MSKTTKCRVPGCLMAIRPAMLMCVWHWTKVPQELKDRVYYFYRLGQQIEDNPSADYLAAARAAIKSVRRKSHE